MIVIKINVAFCNFNKECINTWVYRHNMSNKILDVSQYGKFSETKRDVV